MLVRQRPDDAVPHATAAATAGLVLIEDASAGLPIAPVQVSGTVPRRRPVRWRRILPALAATVAVVAFIVAAPLRSARGSAPPLPFDIETLAADLGLGIEEVTIRGHRRTLESAIFDAVAMDQARSELSLDVTAIRARILRLPWVAEATISRRYPGALDIVIRERVPVAVMSRDGRDVLIDREGRLLGPSGGPLDGRTASGLLRLAGDGASQEIGRLTALLARHSGLSERLARAERVAGRRWTLHLKSGPALLLPADPDGRREAQALDELMSGPDGHRMIDLPVAAIDARLPDRIVVRPDHSAGSNGQGAERFCSTVAMSRVQVQRVPR